jgi:subtilisin family serine protease
MMRLLRLSFLGCALALTAGAASASARVFDVDGAAIPPLTSAIVTVAGPSIAQQATSTTGHGVPGGPASRAAGRDLVALRTAEASVARAQAPVLAAAAQLGVQVVDRYDTATNGLLVHATQGQLAALARVPGVVHVEAAPLVWPALYRAVPYIGARALAQSKGYDGAGVVVAVIDTGLDYTHADFGGPGVAAAYAAANSAPATIDDAWDGRPLFPTAKVVGGRDFVGSRYTSPAFCSSDDERAGRCVSTPHPDPDPLDERSGNWADGHGTHVAGIIAGTGSGGVPPGVAPKASLVSLKVFGLPATGIQPDAPSDVLVSAFDWCVRVNLGLPVEGVAPPRVDVINMSLGGWYDAGGLAYRTALAAARANGIVVVAAAGNDGDHAFVVNAPGTAPESLSVGSAALPVVADYDPLTRQLAGISDFSGRGPGANNTLKPDLTAPGEGIVSARFGEGTGARASSGTSMATPMVTGAAALLAQRNRAEGLGLDARELSALLMNTAQSGLWDASGGAAPVARQGAGMVDAFRAGTASFVATGGDTASLNVGAVSVGEATQLQRSITVRNLTDQPLALRPARAFRKTGWPERGVDVAVPTGLVAVAPRGQATIPVTIALSPGGEPNAWDGLSADGDFSEAALGASEADGQVTLTAEGPEGEPTATWPAQVPFYVLARAASDVQVTERTTQTIRLANSSPDHAGAVEVYRFAPGAPTTDPDEPDVLGALDVRHAVLRRHGDDYTLLVALAAPLSVPQLTSLELYLDTDTDGVIDHRVRTGPQSLFQFDGDPERMQLGISTWDEAHGQPTGVEQIRPWRGPLGLYSRLLAVTVAAADLGVSGPRDLAFYVIHRGLNERWRPGPEVDVAPDGADQAGGPRFRTSPAAEDPAGLSVPALGTADLIIPASEAVLLAFPGNRFEPDGRQFRFLAADPVIPRPTLFLPRLERPRPEAPG